MYESERTKSGIEAFTNHYGLINRDTMNLFFGYKSYEAELRVIELAVLGCTLRQHHIKQIKGEV